MIAGNKDIPVGRLIKALGNADWVNQGRKHLRDDGICPFCQQPTITEELKRQINAFFSGEYEQDVNLIKHFIDQYDSCSDVALKRINALRESLVFYPAAEIDASKLDTIKELLNGYFFRNKAEMLIKEKELGRVVFLSKTAAAIGDLEQLIADGNAAIARKRAGMTG